MGRAGVIAAVAPFCDERRLRHDPTQRARRRSDRADRRAQPRHAAAPISIGSTLRSPRGRRASASAAPISPMASPPARPATRRPCATGRDPISRSSPPTTTCCRRISLTSAFPISSRRRRAPPAASAQVAGGVPAMCDGVTQGEKGMELSLFSRDVIALATAVALSHDMFDAAVYLGICDKIVPGLLIGALVVRPSAGGVPAGRADAVGPRQRREIENPPALRRGQGEPRRAPGRRGRKPTTRPAPAPSTAPPTPTRC